MQHVGVNMCKLRVRQPSRLSHTYLPLADEFAIRGSFATNKPEVGGGTFFAVFWEFDHEILSILPSNMGDLSIHGDVECCLVVLQVPILG